MTDLAVAQHEIGALLSEIATYFKGDPKITLLVRNPDVGPGKDADFLMTNDKIDEAIAALLARKHAGSIPNPEDRSV